MYLATMYCPDLNPVGVPSVFAAGVCLALAAMASPYLRFPLRARRLLSASAPLLLLYLLAYTDGSLLFFARCYPDADDCSAAIIYYVFGFVFAMNCLFFSGLQYRIAAWALSIIFGSMTTLVAVALLTSLRFMHGLRNWREYIVFGSVPVFIIAWTPIAGILARRGRSQAWREHGCCAFCGYDLTGNESGICPECGHAGDASSQSTQR